MSPCWPLQEQDDLGWPKVDDLHSTALFRDYPKVALSHLLAASTFVHVPLTSKAQTQNNITMADPTAFYEPEEDELLSSLAVPNYQDQEEDLRRLQELEEHAYAQQIAAAQEAEQDQGQLLEMVPEDVKRVSSLPVESSDVSS